MESIGCDESYILGLLQTDGHLSEYKGKGKLSIELTNADADIIYKIASVISSKYSIIKRIRTTNFKEDTNSVLFSTCDKNAREKYIKYGLPIGKKSYAICPPAIPYSEPDYYRGIIDGDGSVGISRLNRPFISLFTKSSNLIESYKRFILKVTGINRNISINTRDNMYSICSFNEEAVLLVKVIYYRDFAINRKYENAKRIIQWQRPVGTRKICAPRKKWTNQEDAFILSHTIEESALQLQRTAQSIKMRFWRLTNSNN